MLTSAFIYLFAAVISVPIAKRLGLGSVLGYLLAGALIGPFALNLVGDQTDVMHFAEFGVVMMLFLIGLELHPSRLWQMRKPILALGGSQVLFTAIAIFSTLMLLTGHPWQSNLAIGLALALSSTAIVIQSLAERDMLKTGTGQNVFSVLLFQDIAVIPILALMPMLIVGNELNPDSSLNTHNMLSHLPFWLQGLTILGTIIFIIVGGNYISAPFFRFIAKTHLRELFTATSLLVVVAITLLMEAVGLSPALGAFLAGVVLAENEFRHEIEIDLEPFKGLLLGLFFITVGASIDFQLITDKPTAILLSVFGLVAIKAAILGLIAKGYKMPITEGSLFAAALAQGGEFAFVIITLGAQLGVIDISLSQLVIVVVALSMLITPLILIVHEHLFSKPPTSNDQEADIIDHQGEIIIAGYGRFGQIVGRLLVAQGYNLTILDHCPSQIELLRRFGHKVFYGDAARLDLLHAAGASNAKLLVVAIDDPDKSLDIIKMSKQHFPNLKILGRAIDRRHAYELIRLNITAFRRETFDAALQLGVDALKALGNSKPLSENAGNLFANHDEETMHILSELWGDDNSYGVAVRQRMEDLKQVLLSDHQQHDAINTCHAEEDHSKEPSSTDKQTPNKSDLMDIV